MNSELQEVIDRSERIGIIGSPSSNLKLTIDVLGTAVDKKLVGSLNFFTFLQDGKNHFAMGQITGIDLTNVWAQDATMRGIIRQRGAIDPITEKQDTHTADMILGSVFMEDGDGFEQSMVGTVPSTGTSIKLVSDALLLTILKSYQEQLFYLGNVYGSTPKLPMWFKHFGDGVNGAGEAYHIGVFGKTGSGKSVLAKMAMLGYARHPEMAIFVIDPQGEFARDAKGVANGLFKMDVPGIAKSLSKEVRVHGIQELLLDDWDLFGELIRETRFFEKLQIFTDDKQELAAEALVDRIKRIGSSKRPNSLYQSQGQTGTASSIGINGLANQETFNRIWSEVICAPAYLQDIYAKEGSASVRVKTTIESTDQVELFNNYWRPIATLFSARAGAVSINQLITSVFRATQKPIVIVDLSDASAPKDMLWNESIQFAIITKLLSGITLAAQEIGVGGSSLNTLVVIDEAHRLAPKDQPEDMRKQNVRSTLIDSVRTTRKYGLGWAFISQTLSSIHHDILAQLSIYFFGFGLGIGNEYYALKGLIGGDANDGSLRLYQSFRNPQSSFNPQNRQYPFMAVGPVSPLSFSGQPLFFTAFNTPQKFIDENHLL